MSESDTTTAVLSDESRAWVGRTSVSRPFHVSAVDIAKFAYAVGATDRRHFDEEHARASGHPGIVAPLGFYLTIRHGAANLMPLDELLEDGAANDLTPPSTATRRMAGNCTTFFHRPIYAGDVITLRKRIQSMEEKRGRSGQLAFITYDLQFVDATDAPVVTETFVRILR